MAEMENPRMDIDQRTIFLLHHEATRCRIAFESFMFLLERHFVDKKEDNYRWFLIQDEFCSWSSHLYEVVKLCLARDMNVEASNIEKHLVKQGLAEDKKEAGVILDNMIDEEGRKSVDVEGAFLDKEIVFEEGFGCALRRIRNKHYAHPDKERITLKILNEYISYHYFTAFCCYRRIALYWAINDVFPDASVEALECFKSNLLGIGKYNK